MLYQAQPISASQNDVYNISKTQVSMPIRGQSQNISNTASSQKQKAKSQAELEKQLLAELSASQPDTEMVLIDDELSVDYFAHAYQDGNLKEVSLTDVLTWRQILMVLSKLNQPFTTDTMARCLNTVVSKLAVEHVASIMPKAHAVSRCQVKKSVLRYILQQLSDNQWLRQSLSSQSSTRELWQLTPQALQALSDS